MDDKGTQEKVKMLLETGHDEKNSMGEKECLQMERERWWEYKELKTKTDDDECVQVKVRGGKLSASFN